MIVYYEYNQAGDLVRHKAKSLPNGKFIIDKQLGEWLRVGEASTIPDEPFGKKETNWNKGIKNPIDGKTYVDKHSYMESVKRAGCRVVGRDMDASVNREIRGDYNVKKELKQAIQKATTGRK